MTPVEFHFVLPNGKELANNPVEIQISKSGFHENYSGIYMPRVVNAVTDEHGKVVVDLWPSTDMYYVTAYDRESEAGLSFKFYVPDSHSGSPLRLQDLIVSGPISETNWDEAAILAILETKAEVNAAAQEVKLLVEQATTNVDAIAQLVSNAQTASSAAQTAATSAGTHASTAQVSANSAGSFNSQAGQSASAAEASKVAAKSSETNASLSAITATEAALHAEEHSTTAVSAAQQAMGYKQAAQTSEANARASSEAAITAATQATDAAAQTQADASAASTAASQALDSENNSKASEESAASSASVAGNQAQAAANSAAAAQSTLEATQEVAAQVGLSNAVVNAAGHLEVSRGDGTVYDAGLVTGAKGDAGLAATVTVGSTTTGSAGTNAFVTNTGTANAPILNFTIPCGNKGDKGEKGDAFQVNASGPLSGRAAFDSEVEGFAYLAIDTGELFFREGVAGHWSAGIPFGKGEAGDSATIEIGTVAVGAHDAQASVTNVGTATNAVFDFVIPQGNPGEKGNPGDKGDSGPTNTLSIGTVTEGVASASITGASPNQVLNLVLPKNESAAGAAGGVLSGTYPNPGFAEPMAKISDLGAYLKKSTASGDIAYGREGNVDRLYEVSMDKSAYSIARRRLGGQLIVASPTYGEDATTKDYVDTALSAKADQTYVDTGISGKVDKVAGMGLSENDFTTAFKTKLQGIQVGATANSSDEVLLDRANQTGTQPISSVSGLQGTLDALEQNSVAKSNTSSNILYGRASNAESTYSVSLGAVANTIVQRSTNGVVSVGTPTQPAHAATKDYADSLASGKLDKSTNPKSLYGISANGDQETVPYSSENAGEYLVIRDDAGNFSVSSPAVDGHAANKIYVDAAVNAASASLTAVLDTKAATNKPTLTAERTAAALVGTTVLDANLSNFFFQNVAANKTFTFANPPSANTAQVIVLELYMSGSYTVAFSNVIWNGGISPTLTSGKLHTLVFYYCPSVGNRATSWRGFQAGKDI